MRLSKVSRSGSGMPVASAIAASNSASEISMSSSESALVMSSFSTSDWYRAQELQLPIIEHDSGSCWSLSGANGRSCGLVSCSAGCAYGAEGGYAVGWLAAVIAVIFCI